MDAQRSLARLVRAGWPALLTRYADKLTAHQRRALAAIADCRTGAFGATLMCCPACGHAQPRLRSCGHRSCPRCQHGTAETWLARRGARLLPVEYFMATFTLPAGLRALAYRYPRQVYPALFEALAGTLKRFARNHPQLNAEIGFCAVLHTHSRQLQYHPHVHVVLPGGGVGRDGRGGRCWRTLEKRYLFNGFAMARVFRARCLDAFRRAGLVLPARLPAKWVVHCKHVGRGRAALQYLSRYLYRGVVSERDLVAFDEANQTVTFRYRDARTRSARHLTLPLVEFLWRIALHILPKGLQRVRNYGFLHGNARRVLRLVQLVLRMKSPETPPSTPKPFLCEHCATPMRIGLVLARPRPSG